MQIALGEHVRFSALFQIGAVFGYVILGKRDILPFIFCLALVRWQGPLVQCGKQVLKRASSPLSRPLGNAVNLLPIRVVFATSCIRLRNLL